MKTAFIFTLYKTPKSEVERLKKEVKELDVKDYSIYFIDNTENNRGYAVGVNEGIRKGLKDGADLFVVANPDISFNRRSFDGGGLLAGSKNFDIWGLAMRQEGKIYYGGELDKLRMSGGLIDKKPPARFEKVDFVSGSLMFIKKKVIDKVGLLDESYFLYYEEVDYCFRARRAGFKVGIDSSLIYDHFEVSRDNPKKNYYLFKNRLKFLLKYGTVKQKLYELIRSPKTIYEEVIKRPFYFNFFSLNVSSLINKFLSFILFLLLIRTFAPAEYAVYTLAWTHIGLLLPLLDFGTTSYGLVYLPKEEQKKTSTLFSFRIFLSVITLILTLGLAVVFKYPPQILLAIILTSIVILANTFSGTFLILSSVAEKSYLVSLVSMVFQLILVASTIVAVLLSKNIISVFVIIFILYGLYGLVNLLLLKKQVPGLKFEVDLPAWLNIGKKSILFLVISLLASFYSKTDVLLLNFLKGAQDVGIYSAGHKFLAALMFMVTAYNISAMPMFSRFIREKRKDLFILKIKKDAVLLAMLGGGVAILIFLFSPMILPLFLKGDYSQSISVLRVIIFALPLILLTSVSLNGLYAVGKVKNVIYLFLFQLAYNVVFNYIFIPKFGFIAPAWITLGGETINTVISFTILKYAIDKSFH